MTLAAASPNTPTGAAADAAAAPPRPPTPVPSRAQGVELFGEQENSGFEHPPSLARRGDGQTFQLTALLYAVLEAVDGRRDVAAIAAQVSDRIGKQASADDVAFLLEKKLRPLGLLANPDGSQPAVQKADPLLALRLRLVISNPKVTRVLTAPFAVLFNPVIVAAVVASFFVMVGWLLFTQGLAASTRHLLYTPGLILLVFGLTMLSAGFHEFGHAAACRYGGAQPGAMGCGLYLVWPAFYTDVTDSYRLSRRGRLRTDLGGLYFNMVFALVTVGVWALTGWSALLLLVPLQLLQMVHQLLPFIRLDGYHILADLTGVPDLFARIRPVLASMRPGRPADPLVTDLKPWVRVTITVWVLLVIPVLLLSLGMAALTLPRILATAWDSGGQRIDLLQRAWGDGRWTTVAASALGLVAISLPAASTIYLLSRFAARTERRLWEATSDRPTGRAALLAGSVALAALLAWLWWPSQSYEPIRPGERGTLVQGVRAVVEVPAGRPSPEPPASSPSTSSTSTTEPEPSTTTTTGELPARAASTTAPPPSTTTTTSAVERSSTTATTDTPTTTAPSTTTTTAP